MRISHRDIVAQRFHWYLCRDHVAMFHWYLCRDHVARFHWYLCRDHVARLHWYLCRDHVARFHWYLCRDHVARFHWYLCRDHVTRFHWYLCRDHVTRVNREMDARVYAKMTHFHGFWRVSGFYCTHRVFLRLEMHRCTSECTLYNMSSYSTPQLSLFGRGIRYLKRYPCLLFFCLPPFFQGTRGSSRLHMVY
jgi:hypothetical protein